MCVVSQNLQSTNQVGYVMCVLLAKTYNVLTNLTTSRHYTTLYHTTPHYTTLHHTAKHYITISLHHTTSHYITHHTTSHYITSQSHYISLHLTTLHHTMNPFNSYLWRESPYQRTSSVMEPWYPHALWIDTWEHQSNLIDTKMCALHLYTYGLDYT